MKLDVRKPLAFATCVIVATVMSLGYSGPDGRLAGYGSEPQMAIIGPTEDADPAIGSPGASAPKSNWTTLTMNVKGSAGSWVYAYHPLPAPTKSLRLRTNVDVETFGSGPTALLQMGPAPTIDEGDGFAPAALLDVPPIVLSSGPIHRTYEQGHGIGLGGGAERVLTGIGVAIGSNAPWSASMSVHIPDNDGGTTGPSYVYTNSTAFHVIEENDRLVEGTDDWVNRVRLTGEIPGRGLTLMQIMYRTVQPDGVRDIQIEFADGTYFHRRPLWRGDSSVGCAAGSSGEWGGEPGPMILSNPADLYGTFTDVEGNLWAEMLHAEASTDVGLAAIHVPIDPDDLPEGHLMGGFAEGWFPCRGTR